MASLPMEKVSFSQLLFRGVALANHTLLLKNLDMFSLNSQVDVRECKRRCMEPAL